MTNPRSIRPDVRNPIMALPDAVAALQALPNDSRQALRVVLLAIRQNAAERAEMSWRKHKAPMAAYWKAVAVYAGHIARLVRDQEVGNG